MIACSRVWAIHSVTCEDLPCTCPRVQDIEYTPFSRYIVEFLDIEPTQDDGINFGEWLHCISTVAMFEREEMVRYTFSFADTRQELAIEEEAMRKLVRVVFASTNGIASSAGVMPMISKLHKDKFGLLPFEEFNKLCLRCPTLLFPINRMQVRAGVVVGTWLGTRVPAPASATVPECLHCLCCHPLPTARVSV